MLIQNKRVNYIDSCRGILSMLIIVFHIWGIFNGFISAFVVGSFFVLSGYISSTENYSLRYFVKRKASGLLIPYITVNTSYYFIYQFLKIINLEFICPVSIESKTGLVSYWINVLIFPTNSGWFTASWFLWVLFWVVIFDKICRSIFKRGFIWIYWIFLIIANIVVQYMINAESFWFAYVDLVAIGCLFYNAGHILKKIDILDKLYISITESRFAWGGVYALVLICYAIYLKFPLLAVDWPLRQFENIFVSLIYTIIIFSAIYILSRQITTLGKGEFFESLGKLAMPVMLLQFLVFTLISILEVVTKIKDPNVLPSLSIATYSKWDWVFYTYVSCLIIIRIDIFCRKSRLYRICICGRR